MTERSHRLPRRWRRDDGLTLPELVVAMLVFTIVIVISTAALRSMVTTTVRITDTADTRTDVERLYNRLDKIVPYASAITPEGQAGGDHWVEFRTDVPLAGGGPRCWQLRLDTSQSAVQLRSWPPGTTPATTPPWTTLVTGAQVRTGPGAPPPFDLLLAGESSDGVTAPIERQRLRIALDVAITRAPAYPFDVTYVARNTSTRTLTNTGDSTCTEVPRT